MSYFSNDFTSRISSFKDRQILMITPDSTTSSTLYTYKFHINVESRICKTSNACLRNHALNEVVPPKPPLLPMPSQLGPKNTI